MITELCPRCWLYHVPEADCDEANAQGRAWLVKPPIDEAQTVPEVAQNDTTIRLKRPYVRKAKA